MHKIIEKKVLTKGIMSFKIKAPLVADKALPGQFVIVQLDDFAERIPLTICDMDKSAGEITLIVQDAGRSTRDICALNAGGVIKDILGPLGKPSHIENFGSVVIIGGGVGAAELYLPARALKEKKNNVTVIIGAKSKGLVILEDEFKGTADEIIITTDNGTYGMKGFVTDALKKLFESGREINRIICCGPIPMMKAVSGLARDKAVPAIVSLNAILLDATGMCGTCRCTIDGKVRFSCVDGPEFDGSKVDFDELMTRNRRFLEEEKRALEA